MNDTYKKYGPTLILLVLLYLTYLIFRPFIIPITSAAVIAYLFYPVFKYINKYLKSRVFTSILLLIIIINFLFIPSFFIINRLLKEIPFVHSSLVFAARQANTLNIMLEEIYLKYGVSISLTSIINEFTLNIINFLQNTLFSLPGRAFGIGVMVFFLFFFFKDGPKIIELISNVLPFGKSKSLNIFKKMKSMMDAIFFGQLITAVLHSVLCLIIFTLLSVRAPVIWALIIFIVSIIPMIGPIMVYIPLGISFIINGVSSANNFLLFRGIMLIILGIGVVIVVDNIIRPLVISDKIKIHPALVFIGVLGGIFAFGIIGLILGPIIIVFLLTLFETYEIPEIDK